MKHLRSSLNPFAKEYHPSPSTTIAVLHDPPPPPQNQHSVYYYQPHFRPIRFFPQSPYNSYYIPTSTSQNTVSSSISEETIASIPNPSSPPPATASLNHAHLAPRGRRTRGAYNRRSGGTRGSSRVGRQWSRAPATISAVKRKPGGCYKDGGGRERRVCETSRVCWNDNNNDDVREDNKGEVLELKQDALSSTVMIKNIPAKYTRELLMRFLDMHCKTMNSEASHTEVFTSAYDFLYLPIDFQKKANKGYAFVNFTDPRAAWRFLETKNNQTWDLFCSSKIRQIVCAKLQGKESLVKHFRSSNFRCESDDYLPVSMSPPRDGSAGQKVKLTTVGNRVW